MHFLGKDILRFHCVYWPAMLLAAGYEPPAQLFVHGYLNIDQQKISKSLGNAIDPLDLIDIYGVDAVRFWCASQVTFGQDGNVSLDSFGERYETRARERPRQPRLAHDRDDRPLPRRPAPRTPGPGAFDAAALREEMSSSSTGTTSPARSTRSGRRSGPQPIRRVDAPWNLAKDESSAAELDAVLYDLADGIVAVAVALAPYLPETAPRILDALGQPGDISLECVAAGVAEATEGIEAAPPLFPRVDAAAPAA